MPLRRIDDDDNRWQPPYRCRHPEHNPPSMIVLPPGLYEHECPSCGAKQRFRVAELTMLGTKSWSTNDSPQAYWRVYESPKNTRQVVEWTRDDKPWGAA